ncbi:hypothetical protein A3J19_03730 [Candidatus Daviesbacteria bacterium RIFCSPLOWO2_02_FULL_41_8]|uniref:t-SNARE coiled-coil homology domain-containing protein n=3 Tax=Candidatus Daviesiibacteriota TaxID=1752718 RepID=A0A1F5NKS5_9BACT|nr:MAG: hypothetical protein A2871_00540 [Candidatus Daviesbacteria bacterium RIFCSPHIGHO2_01_FULL_41_23]OGE32883.1 MAG: hypothetical protein A3D83_01840 [Candidatus Daviesbacteria bacterium RIFCSPHIGHO2_02_FULL_41_10]OGE62384.1 MAG: hypothetical protein A2967_01030 [Candidatus Daviesbacteria bacterium RIFCSPLOWO2_01_FULL_41_32]OGE78000.1 MAG: hypothetical protein A3J19_03730 [Candidatus Daviesbacteria bacterium RIFCSPLOWO2_02_FULL_41_8]
MNDANQTTKMLQAILSGQTALKQELIGRIDKVDLKVDGLDGKVDKLDKKIDKVEKRLTERLDKIGMQLAYLEDDTPTREEFDQLEQRVNTLSP